MNGSGRRYLKHRIHLDESVGAIEADQNSGTSGSLPIPQSHTLPNTKSQHADVTRICLREGGLRADTKRIFVKENGAIVRMLFRQTPIPLTSG
jgi:hypothetical protein